MIFSVDWKTINAHEALPKESDKSLSVDDQSTLRPKMSVPSDVFTICF